MKPNFENRVSTRFEHESAVTLENKKTGVQCRARLYNYSDRGLYIESDHRFEPNSEIIIGIANSPYAPEPDELEIFLGVIKWRRPIKHSSYYYGYGVEILVEATSVDDNQDQYDNELLYVGLRRHPRADCAISVKYEYDDQAYEGTTEYVNRGGIFIKTRDPVAVGQMVTVAVPLNEKGQFIKLVAKVTRSSRSGFGVQFVRAE
jgi:Tfp pilus assembly protein PilZ